MRAMVVDKIGAPLRLDERPTPVPGPGELLVEIAACGVCRTDLHILDGDLEASLPVVPGHEIVGRVAGLGAGVTSHRIGERVGVPWLGGACGTCPYCVRARENLCDQPVFTGFHRDGGFATHCLTRADFVLRMPDFYSDFEAAPLLCAGLIGYRAYRMAGDAARLGLYGFGAAAHILAQVAAWEGRRLFAFTRPGDGESQAFARSLGCEWAGGSDEPSPEPLDAAILFAPIGALVPQALRQVVKGGRVVCAGIHMSDIPSFPYADLWGERAILSVANLTRADGEAFLGLAPRVPVRTATRIFPLDRANEAVGLLRAGAIAGAAVLDCRG